MKQGQGREGEERKELFSGPPLVVGGVHGGREISSLAGWERKWSSSVYFSPFLSPESRSKERGGKEKKSIYSPSYTYFTSPHWEEKGDLERFWHPWLFSLLPNSFSPQKKKVNCISLLFSPFSHVAVSSLPFLASADFSTEMSTSEKSAKVSLLSVVVASVAFPAAVAAVSLRSK